MRHAGLTSAANNSKWDELRLAMYDMDEMPAFRCKMLNGHYSKPDTEWFYHFRDGGYDDILFTDIVLQSEGQRDDVLFQLKAIGLAGEATPEGFRVYGYIEPGQALERF